MPYGYHTKAIIYESHHWVELNSLMRTLNMMKCQSFSVKSVREQMRNTLANLPFDIPFSEKDRFPADKSYIDLNHSVPNNMLKQLIMALDLADRQTEKGRSEPESNKIRELSNFEDAKTSFYNTLYKFLDLAGPLQPWEMFVYGIYTQGTFEEKLNLVWS